MASRVCGWLRRPLDAVVLDHRLRFLDGAAIADEIKPVRAKLPIVIPTENLELPYGALNSVDAIVIQSDGDHFLQATLHFMLSVKPAQRLELTTRVPAAPVAPNQSSNGFPF